MKRTLVAILVLTTSISFIGCSSKKMSEEMKTTMTTFEADWAKSGEAMTAWGQTMTTSTGELTAMMTETMSMDMSKLSPAMMAQGDSLKNVCNGIMTSMTEMKTAYETAMSNWAADQTKYTEMKAKLESGDMNENQGMKNIEELMGKVTATNANMESWNTMLNDMKAKCTSTCDAIKGMMPAM